MAEGGRDLSGRRRPAWENQQRLRTRVDVWVKGLTAGADSGWKIVSNPRRGLGFM